MAETDDIKAGATIEVGHPFIRAPYSAFNGEETYEAIGWRPGTRDQFSPPDDVIAVADAIGTQILTVVSIHRPGRFPTRVFYTRLWRDPDGREFGKGHLRMATLATFRHLINGYRHPFEIAVQNPAIEKKESAIV